MKRPLPVRWLWRAAAATALALAFAAYLQPDLMVRLASELWACF
ncbi:MAG TPA: hypothetical protein VFQ16_16215 [Burkholderiaceae bacterium]|nr:hypothetical protein [Burkholderiaceae bacterium]